MVSVRLDLLQLDVQVHAGLFPALNETDYRRPSELPTRKPLQCQNLNNENALGVATNVSGAVQKGASSSKSAGQ